MVLNEVTGAVMSSRWFDTYESEADSDFLIGYLKGLKQGRIICFAVKVFSIFFKSCSLFAVIIRFKSLCTVNSEDLFKPYKTKLALRPLELLSPLWGYFSHSWDRTNPIESRNSPQWDPISSYGAGPAPVNRAIMALK